MIHPFFLHRYSRAAASFFVVWLLVFVAISASPLRAVNKDPYDPSKIKAFTGAPTRLVWLQDTTDVPALYGERPTLRLMGFDTEDGKEERAILEEPAAYLKVLITADGSRVVFGDNLKKTVSVVNWDGSGLKVLLENAAFEDVWTDPVTGVEWFYATVEEKRGDKQVPVIRRYRMDDPTVNELVWDKMPIYLFTVSGDGSSASGGNEGGNSPQGVLTLPNGQFHQRGKGCWPSMAPDDSGRSWVFSGNHRSMFFHVPLNREGTLTQVIPMRLDESPGLSLSGREEVYFIRWSNNTRFMVCSAPFSQWDFRGPVKIPAEVAENVEVYIGRFSEDMTKLEEWMRVTANDRGDYRADVWIQPGEGKQAVAVDRSQAGGEELPAEKLNQEDLVYTWETGAVGNQIDDPATGTIRQCSGQLKEYARFGRFHVMDLTGGWFVPDDAVQPLLKAVQKNKALTLEAIITPLQTPDDDRVVMLFGQSLASSQVALYQRGNRLYLGLGKEEWELGPITEGQPNHVVVSLSEGHLLCTINGRQAMINGTPTVAWSQWKAVPLVFGAAPDGARDWSGTLEGIRIFGRPMDFQEARQRYLVQKKSRQDREAIEPVLVEAKLLMRSAAASPSGIAPYRRCLNVNLYEVEKVIQGDLPDKKIAVAQWSVLDAKVIPEYEALKEGSTQTLALEPWDKHPEQDSERKIEGEFLDEVKLYYDVTRAAPAAQQAQPPGGEAGDQTWTSAESGLWSQADRWSGGRVPGPRDAVVLGDVPSGKRQILTDQSVTIQALTMEQQGAGTNLLKLGNSFAIRGSEKPLNLPEAPTAILDTNGQQLLLQAESLPGVEFHGTVRLSGTGAVTAATVLRGGVDYTHPPKVQFKGTGQGAVAEVGMEVFSIRITHLGSGYTQDSTVTLSEPDVVGGRQAQATVKIDPGSGALSEIKVTDPGSGYLAAPQVMIEGGGGQGGRAEALLSVSEIYIRNGGSGYTEPPTIEFVGGDGTEARALAATQSTILRGTDKGADLVLTNLGKVEQLGGRILLDWAGTERKGGTRRFHNQGEWTLKNATLKFISSTGMPSEFGNGNTNSGTLRILDHSWVGLSSLVNTGELELGAGVVLGQLDFALRTYVLRNEGEGIVRVTGGTVDDPGTFGVNSLFVNRPRNVYNGSENDGGHAQWILGDGRSPAAFRITSNEVEMFNYEGARLEIQAKAALMLETNLGGSSDRTRSHKARLANQGEMTLAGALYVRINHAGFGGIDNYHLLKIEGDEAQLVRLTNSAGPASSYKAPDSTSLIANRPGAELKGSGMLTYVDQTGAESAHYMRIINQGNLEPQGTWTLNKVNVYFGVPIPGKNEKTGKEAKAAEAGGTLTIRIPSAGKPGGALVLKGQEDYGHFVLTKGSGTILNVVSEGSGQPSGTFRIVTAVAVEGEFDALQFNGASEVPYTVTYQPEGIDVVFP